MMPFDPVLARLTFRQLLARRRWMLVVALAAVPVLMAVLDRIYASLDEDRIEMIARSFPALIFAIIVPFIALILANSALGGEIDDGTVIYILAKPIPRSQIVITKLIVTSLVCAVLSMASVLIAGLLALHGFDATHLLVGFTVGAGVGSVLYTAIFLALGLITRRGMLVGLVYLVVWEGVLAPFFAGTRVLSVRQYMTSFADAITTVDENIFKAGLPTSTAYYMSAIVLVGATALCIDQLRKFQIGQAS